MVGSPSLVLRPGALRCAMLLQMTRDGSSAGGKKHVIRKKLAAASEKPQQAMYLATRLPAV